MGFAVLFAGMLGMRRVVGMGGVFQRLLGADLRVTGGLFGRIGADRGSAAAGEASTAATTGVSAGGSDVGVSFVTGAWA